MENKYDRIAGGYDAIDWLIPEAWRRRATGYSYGQVLEVGIGTGLNLPFYPKSCQEIFGVDVSRRMLERAGEKAVKCKVPVKLEVMDIQSPPLTSGSFDSVLATFTFCSIPDPEKGLRECHRLLKPGGRLILLEHMRSNHWLLHPLMNWLNPFTVKFLGDHITQNTFATVAVVGFQMQIVENLWGDVIRLIVAER